MMNPAAVDIEKKFIQKVSKEVRLIPQGNERYRVSTPFMFDDGDYFSIVLKRRGDGWVLSDEGHTYMQLTHHIDESDLFSGNRGKIISNALAMFYVQDLQSELVIDVIDDDYGEALFTFVQALMKIADVSYLSRERVRRTFRDDFRDLMRGTVPAERMNLDWHNPSRDEEGKYKVDCRVNGMSRPLFIYALNNDTHTRDAIIALQQFAIWEMNFEPVGVFENKEFIPSVVQARFDAVCPKQFANLSADSEEIVQFIKGRMNGIGSAPS